MGDEAAKYLETARADRSVWLMKCPPVVSQAWQGASSSSGEANPNPVVAKVVLSLNPLSAAEPTLQARSPAPDVPLIPSSPVLRVDVVWICSVESPLLNCRANGLVRELVVC